MRYLFAILVVLCLGCGGEPSTNSIRQLRTGMTRQEVHNLLGSPDRDSRKYDSQNGWILTEVWDRNEGTDQWVWVILSYADDRVMDKMIINLMDKDNE